jgi:hypothetical protein
MNIFALCTLQQNLIGSLVRAAAVRRAQALHDLAVMSTQTDVPFRLYDRVSIATRVWAYDRICGPIQS